MTNILLLGSGGQIGWELVRTLAPLGRVYAYSYPQIDLKYPDTLCNLIQEIRPEVLINAAAYTAVDQAESEQEIAMSINGIAPGIMAELIKALGATLIHFSTDYVFDGRKDSFYNEDDTPEPLNFYGKSKLAGEQAIRQVNPCFLLFRTSWVYSLRRDSFVTRLIKKARTEGKLHIVTDQIGSPTWARMVAEATAQVLAMAKSSRETTEWLKEHKGIYHLAGTGSASRFEWAGAIIDYAGIKNEFHNIDLSPATTDQFPTPAKRPFYSALDCHKFERTFSLKLPPWRESLKLALNN